VTISQYFVDDVCADSHADDYYAQVVGAFEEVALMTSSGSVPLGDVLRLVGQRLCELLDVSRCSVYLRRDDGRFQGQVGYCPGRSIDAGVSRLVSGVEDDRFTAEIIAKASPVVVRDATHDPRTIQRTMRQWGVLDMLGVPLVVDGDVIGIIYVDNQGRRRDYTQRDIKLAQAFAGLSALAVQQAWLYQQLAERAKVIDHQRRVLGETTVIHSRVTRAVLDGADTDAILALIVEMLAKPVVLYSPKLDIVSWAAPAGSDQSRGPGMTAAQLALPWVRESLESLANGSPSAMLRASQQTRCRRLWVRMVVDLQCVGYLELCEIGRAFSRVDSKALEQASTAVALKLLTDQRNHELQRQEREEFLADILYGRRDYESLARRAAFFGVDIASGHAVLRLQYAKEAEDDACTGQQRRAGASALVARHLGPAGRPVAATSVPGADLLLIEVPPAETGAPDSALSVALRSAFPRLDQRFGVRFAVVSDICRSLRGLPSSAERARDTVDLLTEAAAGPRMAAVAEYDLVRLVTRRDGVAGATRYAEELLRPLVEHDAECDGALLPTLEAFIQCEAQIRSTALLLAVHENTVRYRLNKVREVSSIEPKRLDSLLNVAMALKVQHLFRARSAAAG